MNDKDLKLRKKQSSPMTASVSWNPNDDTRKDREQWYGQLLEQTIITKFGLINEDTAENVLRLSVKHKLETAEQVGEVSRIVRDVFVHKIPGKEVVARVEGKLGLKGETRDSFINDLKEVVIATKKTGEKEFSKEFERLPIIPALNKYKKLKDQEITARDLIIHREEEFREPTIKNWIEVYIKDKGAQAHNNIERSGYLFDSLNAKELSGEDRWKVARILESYDEDKALLIYKEEQEVYFEKPGVLEGMKEKVARKEKQLSQAIPEVEVMSQKIPEEKQEQVSEISMANRKSPEIQPESPTMAKEKEENQEQASEISMANRKSPENLAVARGGINKPELQQKTDFQTEAKKKEHLVIKNDSLVIESAQKSDYEKLQEELSGENRGKGKHETEELSKEQEEKIKSKEINQKNIIDLRKNS